jgi:hypothetical protein
MAHFDIKAQRQAILRKSGGTICEVRFCSNAAEMVHRVHGVKIEGYLCAKHWDWIVGEFDGFFHQLLSLTGRPWKMEWNQTRKQTMERHVRMRTSMSPWWRDVMFGWSIGADVDTETLRTAAEHGWSELQELYKTTSTLEAEMFWQIRNEADHLCRAMTHICRNNQGAAKRWQLELTPKPRTFCRGTPLGGLPKPQKPLKPWRLGCGRVFDDTERASGGRRSYWLAWCPDCKPSGIAATRR